jgi:hypothetical protein
MSSEQHLLPPRTRRIYPFAKASVTNLRYVASAENSFRRKFAACVPPSILADFQISNFKSEIFRRVALGSKVSGAHSSANLCESQRLCVIFFPAFLPLPALASCNSQLQLRKFLGSVDSREFKSDLSPFRINTSKNLRTFRIAHIRNDLKSPIINTSMKNEFKFPRSNTSEKSGGGGSSCNSSCNWPVAAMIATRVRCPPGSKGHEATGVTVPHSARREHARDAIVACIARDDRARRNS